MAGLWGVISFICINALLSLPSSLSLPSEGNVGCLFSKSLCDPEQEICVDDGVFGRCKQIFELDSDTPPFRYELSSEELASLTEEVEALFAQGYRWHHPATQCILQTLLSSFLTGREFSKVFCDTLRDREPRIGEPAPDQELMDVKNMAYIRYKPSEMDPNPEFADEIYSPPGLPEKFDVPEEEQQQPEEELMTNLERRSELPVLFSKLYNTPERFRTGFESRDQQGIMENLNDEPEVERRSGILFPDINEERFERRSDKLSNLLKEQINGRPGILLPNLNEEEIDRRLGILLPDLNEEEVDRRSDVPNLNEELADGRSDMLMPNLYEENVARRLGVLSNLKEDQIDRRPGMLMPNLYEEQIDRTGMMPNLNAEQINRRLGMLMPNLYEEQIDRRSGMPMPNLNEEQMARRSGLLLSDLNKEQIERRSGVQLPGLKKEQLDRGSSFLLPNLNEEKMERDGVLTSGKEEPEMESKLHEPLSHFRKHYNSPEAFRDASHHHDAHEDGPEMGVMRRSPALDDSLDFDSDLDPAGPDLDLNLGGLMNPEEVISVKKELGDVGSGFSEGGPLVLGPTRNDMNNLVAETNSDLSDLLDELDEWSFQRRERLDVKKPGPQFSTNNYAFQDTSTKKVQDSINLVTKPSSKPAKVQVSQEGQKETMPSELPNHPLKAKIQSRTLWFQSILGDPHKKGVKSSHYSQHAAYVSPSKNSVLDNEQYDVVDTTYTYIEFKDSITTWKEGAHIVKTVAKLLDVPVELFSHQRMDRNEVTFKVVEPNDLGLNAYEVARRIDGIKDQLKKDIGVVVTSVGVGDKNKLPTAVKLNEREEQAYVVIVMVCGVLAALGLSAGVLYLTRRHGNKLANMTSSDTEPSKHYQDLCRARMSSKNGDSGSAVPPHRVASLSRESDNSPSSRSSTSSWSEEPVLSNMDVATGQLVLGYMEEHLKNKDRLESEWAALCAYKADPCATTIAEKEENKSKNRSETAMPYDHARVVLNELSNITGSDYINASTITDHDPRNPAYIVTQGPLPTTAPDFWQMVWEQGCVVIVMLTRLVENDTAMCHRYWPAEGSELYHIFEVHLVSEHIWCDDYLVRSFYLKNMKTGETRTVTQFHFLSWPEASVPQLTKPLLEFRRKVNKSFRGRSCPIVVHCSDGVGRSGTYCLLDMVLNRMAKGAKEIDVAATLEHIRDQRAGALATSHQFRFVLSAVSDELHAILRVHPQATQ